MGDRRIAYGGQPPDDMFFRYDEIDAANMVYALARSAVQNVHDDLNCNANIQVGDVDVGVANPIQVQAGSDILTIVQTPAITAGAEHANDALGGLLTFANAVRVSGGECTIRSIMIKDLASQDGEIDLVFFDRTFTATADNAAFDPSDADLANCVGHIKIRVSDYVDFADNSIATRDNLGLAMTLNGTSLFAQAVLRTAETYVATSDITIKVTVERH